MSDKETILDLIKFLEKEEVTTQLMVDSSIDSLIESGKTSSRISCIKYLERLKIIKLVKNKLSLSKNKDK